jgi:hypothetical protein
MRKWLSVPIIMLCLLLSGGLGIEAKQGSGSQVVLLHFCLKDDVIRLVKTETRRGAIRQRRGGEKSGHIRYEVQNRHGRRLFVGLMRDPSLMWIDQVDPDNPDRLRGGLIKLSEVAFTLRIPLRDDADRISFRRIRTAEGRSNRPETGGKPLGNVRLRLKRK